VYRGRIQTVDNLKRRRWNGDEKCQFCLKRESAGHLLFRGPLAVYIWAVIRDVLGWKTLPRDVKSFVEDFMFARGDKRNGMLVFLFGAISWTLWLNKNDLIFNNKIISIPRALIFKFVSFLHWVIAWTGPDREGLEQLIESLTRRMDDDRVVLGVG
jgi:hypothetical protein